MASLSHHATILPVNDMEGTLDFYTTQLGFECTFRWETPTTYAVLKRDGVSIHISLQDYPVEAPKNVSLYIFCHDVAQTYREFSDKKVNFYEPLNTTDYQMKEFIILDPNGFKIGFGQEV